MQAGAAEEAGAEFFEATGCVRHDADPASQADDITGGQLRRGDAAAVHAGAIPAGEVLDSSASRGTWCQRGVAARDLFADDAHVAARIATEAKFGPVVPAQVHGYLFRLRKHPHERSPARRSLRVPPEVASLCRYGVACAGRDGTTLRARPPGPPSHTVQNY